MNSPLNVTIFIVALSAATLGYLAWVFYGPLKRHHYAKNTVKTYYKTVNQAALDLDAYLVNAFQHEGPGSSNFHIDHVLIGDKFIYVLADRYYPGTVLGKPEDQRWIFYRGKKSKDVPNPMILNRLRADKIRELVPIEEGLVIPLVLINDDCYISPMEFDDETGYVLSLHQLGRFLEEKEAEDIAPIDPKMAKRLAQKLHERNGKEWK